MLLIDAFLKGDVGFIESHVSENPKSINEKDEVLKLKLDIFYSKVELFIYYFIS